MPLHQKAGSTFRLSAWIAFVAKRASNKLKKVFLLMIFCYGINTSANILKKCHPPGGLGIRMF